MDVRAALLVLAMLVLMVTAGTLLARKAFESYRTPDGDSVANRLLGRSPADYFADQDRLPARRRPPGPPVAELSRRLAVGGCAVMAVGSLLAWARLGGPFAPNVYAFATVPGRLFTAGVAAAAILVFHQSTHGARLLGRLLLLALALPLTTIAVLAVVDPPGVGAAWGAWLSLAGSLMLLGGAVMALRDSNPQPPDR